MKNRESPAIVLAMPLSLRHTGSCVGDEADAPSVTVFTRVKKVDQMAKQKADNKAARKRKENAINCFPKRAIRQAFDSMADGKATQENGKTAADNASFILVSEAEAYGKAAREVTQDVTTILADWRENMRGLAMEMAVAGHKFASLTKGKDGKPDTAKLTGTGDNVASIAKGVVDFGLTLAQDVPQATDGELSYRDVRAEVERLRKERRDAANPDAALLRDAKAACDDQWTALRELVFGTDDLELVEALTAALAEMQKREQAAQDEAAQVEAEAEQQEAANG